MTTSHYDLHCHSTRSDGLLPPAELVTRAAARGVRVLALTD
ncbi:MAG TPA: PHP domain-containing protein, partial [Burkholderiales bacterium]|nr:PHP domain-containing protein [Burkholderiales bacterium]